MKGKKTGGRTRGTPNRTTAACKEALSLAFDGIGGVAALRTWAKANQTQFYKLWSKMLPQEVTGENGGPLQVRVVFEEVLTP